MHNAKNMALIAALALTAWFVTFRCSTSTAQDAFGDLSGAGEDFAYRPLVAPGDDFADDAAWDSPEGKSADLTWTQRIAKLTRGRTQLEGG